MKATRIFLIGCFLFLAGVDLAAPIAFGEVKEIEGLVRVQDVDSNIVLDLRYATENNFTGKKVYPVAVCVLRKEAAQKLAAANAEFMKDGYRIKVWDAYRPPYVQKIFWNLVPDERYVANPNKGGSRHNRGGAVDITLVDKDGKELEMPTGFDDFSEKASPTNPNMSPQARKNVDYLTSIMTKNGFLSYEHEWWHFDDNNWRDFPLVDVILERFLDNDFDMLNTLPQETRQALVVREKSAGDFHATLTAWEKQRGGWQIVFDPVDAVIGKNGFTPTGKKKEGDGKTPSGIFPLGAAFGYDTAVDTKLIYRQATENDFWVDDLKSAQYNKWVTGTPQATSFERMKRDDDLYQYGVVIEYNTNPVVPGAGSAIFLHVWRGADSPTAGCVAIPEENLLSLLRRLDRSKNPVVVLGGMK